MTFIDWIVVLLAIAAAVHGALRGFLVSALALAGFALGAFLGARLGPLVLSGGQRSPWSPLLTLVAALLLGGLFGTILELLGLRARRVVRLPFAVAADAVAGAALGAVVALAVAWIAGAVALQTPGLRELRQDVQRSHILSALNDALPPSGPILRALARFDPLPAISGPSLDDVAEPARGITASAGVRTAADGTVRILGLACGLGVEGSGWIAAPGIVVTNAHVVAGTEGDIVVRPHENQDRQLVARAVAFDTRNDIAILSVRGLTGRVLRLVADPADGTSGAILGYPHNGPFDARAARIGATRTTTATDAYGEGPVRRDMTSIRGLLRSGNSGGPVVDAQGRVLATVFAASTSGDAPGGYGVPNAVVRDVLARTGADAPQVATGPCTDH